MKVIKYHYVSAQINNGTEERPNIELIFSNKTISWNEINEEIAKKEAYNGKYTIEDDGIEEIQSPSQLDQIEAQIAYTAMITNTLIQ